MTRTCPPIDKVLPLALAAALGLLAAGPAEAARGLDVRDLQKLERVSSPLLTPEGEALLEKAIAALTARPSPFTSTMTQLAWLGRQAWPRAASQATVSSRRRVFSALRAARCCGWRRLAMPAATLGTGRLLAPNSTSRCSRSGRATARPRRRPAMP